MPAPWGGLCLLFLAILQKGLETPHTDPSLISDGDSPKGRALQAHCSQQGMEIVYCQISTSILSDLCQFGHEVEERYVDP